MSRLIRITGGLNALALIMLGLSRTDLPGSTGLKAHPDVLFIAVVVSATAGLLQSVISERGATAKARSLELEATVQAFLTSALIAFEWRTQVSENQRVPANAPSPAVLRRQLEILREIDASTKAIEIAERAVQEAERQTRTSPAPAIAR